MLFEGPRVAGLGTGMDWDAVRKATILQFDSRSQVQVSACCRYGPANSGRAAARP